MALFGRDTASDLYTYNPGDNNKSATKYTNNAGNFTVISMRTYGFSANGTTYRLVIYDTSGNLLAQTKEIVGDGTTKWHGHQLQTPLAVTDSTDYYLCLHWDTGSGSIRNDIDFGSETDKFITNADTYSDGPADPFGTDAGGTDRLLAIVAQSTYIAVDETITVNQLTLASSPTDLRACGVCLDEGGVTLASSAVSVNVAVDQTVSVNQLTLASSILALTIIPGPTSVVMGQVTLAGAVPNTTPGLSVAAGQLTLAGATVAMTAVPGPATVTVNQLTLTGVTATGQGIFLPFVNADWVSPAELTVLRDDDHEMEIFGSALVPAVIWSARINNASIGRGDTTIVFDSGSGSDFTLVEAYQEVVVGTTPGDDNIGRLRVRSVSSGDGGVTGTLTVASHSWILANDYYLTFRLDYPIRTAFPLIQGDGTFLKDRVDTYGDENEEPPPVVVAGPHRAEFIGETDVVFNVDSSRSYTIAEGATISSHSLSILPATGSTVSFDSGTGVGTVTFTTTGQRWAKYTVTDSNGKSQISYRSYFVHSPDATDQDYPLFQFHNFRMSGTWERGGWQSFFVATGDNTLSDIPNETLVVIWGTPKYQGIEQTITLLPDAATTLLAGYLIRANANTDLESGLQRVDFEVHTIQEMMRRYNFSVSLEAVEGTPNKWWKYEDWLTVGRAIHHLWRYHSSIMHIADVVGLMNNTIRRAYSEFEEGDLYTMADSFARSRGIRAHVVCDKAGRIHLTHDLQLLTDAERPKLPKAFEITVDDRRGNIRLDSQAINRAAFVKTSGFSWDGSFRTDESGNRVPDATPLCASAPGIIPDDEGQNVYNFDRQTFRDQAHCNAIAGRVFAQQNNEFPNVPVVFHGNYAGVLDIAYELWYTMSLQVGDTARSIVWTDKRLACRTVAIQYDGDKGAMLVQANMEAEQDAVVGVAGYCLDSFPNVGGDVPDVPAPADLPDALMTGSSVFFKSAAGKAWANRSSDSVKDLAQDPYWPTKQGTTGSNSAIVWSCGLGFIRRSVDGYQNRTDVTPSTNPPNDAGDAPAPTVGAVDFIRVEGNPAFSNEFIAVGRWQNTSGDWRSWIVVTRDDGATWEWGSIGEFEAPASSTDITGYTFTDLDTASVGEAVRGVKLNSVRYFAHTNGNKGHILSRSGNTFTLEASDTATGTTVKDNPGVFRMSDSEAWAMGMDAYIAPIRRFVVQKWSIPTDTTVSHVATYVSDEVPVANELSEVVSGGRYTSLTDGRLVAVFSSSFMSDCVIGTITFNTVTNTWSAVDILWQSPGSCGGVGKVIGLDDRHVLMVGSRPEGPSGAVVWIRDMNTGVDGPATLVSADHTVYFQGDPQHAILPDNRVVLGTIRNNGITNLLEPHVVQWDGLTTAAPIVGPTGDLFGLGDDSDADVALASDGVDHVLVVRDYNGTQNEQRAQSYRVKGLTTYKHNNLTFQFNDTEVAANYFQSVHGLFHDTGNFWVNLTRRAFINPGYPRIQRVEVEEPGALTFTGGFRALGASIGKGVGGSVWITAHDEGNLELALFEYLLPVPTWLQKVSLGDASIAEVDALTYIAFPYAVWGDDSWVVVFGRLNNPDGLGTPQHIIETVDHAANFTSLEARWGTDQCGAVVVEADGLVTAIRNRGTSSKLYRGLLPPFDLMSTLTFPAGVNTQALDVDVFSGAVYACANIGNSVMVLKSLPPYLDWENMTYDHGTSDGINAILLL